MSDLVKDIYGYTPTNLATNSVIMGRDATQMDMNDFFTLLVAQLTNQDMLNPSSDTEFVAQMAQFTALNGIQTIQEYQLSSYAVTYVGKEVVIAQINEKTYELEQIEGVVTHVVFYDGEPMLVVDKQRYPLYTVMEVMEPGEGSIGDKEPEEEKEEEI